MSNKNNIQKTNENTALALIAMCVMFFFYLTF